MSDRFSLLALVAASLLVGAVFCYVLWPFLVPLFFAAVLSLIFRPMFLWLVGICRGYRRCAAAIASLAILLLLLAPLTIVLVLAGRELLNFGQQAVQAVRSAEDGQLVDPRDFPRLADWIESLRQRMPADTLAALRQVASRGLETYATDIYQQTRSVLTNAFHFVVGLAILALAIYYFLVDGPAILRTTKRLSPLEDDDMQELFDRFHQVCRSVILGTFVAAFVQSVLAGAAFLVLGVEGEFLLALLTLFAAMIPFLGSAAVWMPVVIALLLQERYPAAIGLAIWGAAVVSTADNLVRTYVVHERSRLHPLLVLVSMLGALRVVGLWGIFLGPIVAALLYTLLTMLQQRLRAGATESALAG